MGKVTLYTTPLHTIAPRSIAHGRESLIYAEVQRALASIADLDCQTVLKREPNTTSPPPGLAFVLPHTPVIALGPEAHVALADVSKRTLIAHDLALGDAAEAIDEPIDQLVWSSFNTTRIVAVGTPAWESIQLLPAAERCFHDVPPLPMQHADTDNPSILVIDHEATAARALALVEALRKAALRVELVASASSDPTSAQQDPWAGTAWIHVHVGEHTFSSDLPRLADSWHNGRLTIHMLDRPSQTQKDASPRNMTIDDHENGFMCSTPDQVIAVCRDLLDDPVLRDKIVAVGRGRAAPLAQMWRAIAQDLLS